MTDPTTHSTLVPIREVSRRTGVNSVTLRAWERRYGLLKPRRTDKGHRLYSQADIERIEHILQWLNRGAAISQVRELLEREMPAEASRESGHDTVWSAYRDQLRQAIHDLREHKVDDLLNEMLALYPVDTFVAKLMLPLLEELEPAWSQQFGGTLQARFLEQCLRTKATIRLHQGNRFNRGNRVLLVSLPEEPWYCRLLLTSLAVSALDYRVHLLEGQIPPAELPLAVEKMEADLLMLYGSQAQDNDTLQRLPRLTDKLAVPVAVTGPAATLHRQSLEAAGLHSLPQLTGNALTALVTAEP